MIWLLGPGPNWSTDKIVSAHISKLAWGSESRVCVSFLLSHSSPPSPSLQCWRFVIVTSWAAPQTGDCKQHWGGGEEGGAEHQQWNTSNSYSFDCPKFDACIFVLGLGLPGSGAPIFGAQMTPEGACRSELWYCFEIVRPCCRLFHNFNSGRGRHRRLGKKFT